MDKYVSFDMKHICHYREKKSICFKIITQKLHLFLSFDVNHYENGQAVGDEIISTILSINLSMITYLLSSHNILNIRLNLMSECLVKIAFHV